MNFPLFSTWFDNILKKDPLQYPCSLKRRGEKRMVVERKEILRDTEKEGTRDRSRNIFQDLKSEQTLIRKMQEEQDREARDALICGYLWLVHSIAGKYDFPCGREELVSVGILGPIKAVDSYDGGMKNRLGTYAVRCIMNEICSYVRRQHFQRVLLLETVTGGEDAPGDRRMEYIGMTYPEPQKAVEEAEERRRLQKLLQELSAPDQMLLQLRYFEDTPLTQKETAERLGTTQSVVSRREKKILLRLREGLGSDAGMDGFTL